MTDLFGSDDPAAYRAALARYPDVVAAQGVPRLVELDTFHREVLPARLSERAPVYATLDDLVASVEWKMKRGEWRARNLMLVKSNAATQVEQTTERAFASIPHPRRPVDTIAELAGVGPATASALLCAVRPDLYPFFDDLVARQIPGLGAVKYTGPYYAKYAEALHDKAAALGLTAHDVAQALWAHCGGKTGQARLG